MTSNQQQLGHFKRIITENQYAIYTQSTTQIKEDNQVIEKRLIETQSKDQSLKQQIQNERQRLVNGPSNPQKLTIDNFQGLQFNSKKHLMKNNVTHRNIDRLDNNRGFSNEKESKSQNKQIDKVKQLQKIIHLLKHNQIIYKQEIYTLNSQIDKLKIFNQDKQPTNIQNQIKEIQNLNQILSFKFNEQINTLKNSHKLQIEKLTIQKEQQFLKQKKQLRQHLQYMQNQIKQKQLLIIQKQNQLKNNNSQIQRKMYQKLQMEKDIKYQNQIKKLNQIIIIKGNQNIKYIQINKQTIQKYEQQKLNTQKKDLEINNLLKIVQKNNKQIKIIEDNLIKSQLKHYNQKLQLTKKFQIQQKNYAQKITALNFQINILKRQIDNYKSQIKFGNRDQNNTFLKDKKINQLETLKIQLQKSINKLQQQNKQLKLNQTKIIKLQMQFQQTQKQYQNDIKNLTLQLNKIQNNFYTAENSLKRINNNTTSKNFQYMIQPFSQIHNNIKYQQIKIENQKIVQENKNIQEQNNQLKVNLKKLLELQQRLNMPQKFNNQIQQKQNSQIKLKLIKAQQYIQFQQLEIQKMNQIINKTSIYKTKVIQQLKKNQETLCQQKNKSNFLIQFNKIQLAQQYRNNIQVDNKKPQICLQIENDQDNKIQLSSELSQLKALQYQLIMIKKQMKTLYIKNTNYNQLKLNYQSGEKYVKQLKHQNLKFSEEIKQLKQFENKNIKLINQIKLLQSQINGQNNRLNLQEKKVRIQQQKLKQSQKQVKNLIKQKQREYQVIILQKQNIISTLNNKIQLVQQQNFRLKQVSNKLKQQSDNKTIQIIKKQYEEQIFRLKTNIQNAYQSHSDNQLLKKKLQQAQNYINNLQFVKQKLLQAENYIINLQLQIKDLKISLAKTFQSQLNQSNTQNKNQSLQLKVLSFSNLYSKIARIYNSLEAKLQQSQNQKISKQFKYQIQDLRSCLQQIKNYIIHLQKQKQNLLSQNNKLNSQKEKIRQQSNQIGFKIIEISQNLNITDQQNEKQKIEDNINNFKYQQKQKQQKKKLAIQNEKNKQVKRTKKIQKQQVQIKKYLSDIQIEDLIDRYNLLNEQFNKLKIVLNGKEMKCKSLQNKNSQLEITILDLKHNLNSTQFLLLKNISNETEPKQFQQTSFNQSIKLDHQKDENYKNHRFSHFELSKEKDIYLTQKQLDKVGTSLQEVGSQQYNTDSSKNIEQLGIFRQNIVQPSKEQFSYALTYLRSSLDPLNSNKINNIDNIRGYDKKIIQQLLLSIKFKKQFINEQDKKKLEKKVKQKEQNVKFLQSNLQRVEQILQTSHSQFVNLNNIENVFHILTANFSQKQLTQLIFSKSNQQIIKQIHRGFQLFLNDQNLEFRNINEYIVELKNKYFQYPTPISQEITNQLITILSSSTYYELLNNLDIFYNTIYNLQAKIKQNIKNKDQKFLEQSNKLKQVLMETNNTQQIQQKYTFNDPHLSQGGIHNK